MYTYYVFLRHQVTYYQRLHQVESSASRSNLAASRLRMNHAAPIVVVLLIFLGMPICSKLSWIRWISMLGKKHMAIWGDIFTIWVGNLGNLLEVRWEAQKSHPRIQLSCTPRTPSRVEQNAKSAEWQWHKVCHPFCTDHLTCDERRWPNVEIMVIQPESWPSKN